VRYKIIKRTHIVWLRKVVPSLSIVETYVTQNNVETLLKVVLKVRANLEKVSYLFSSTHLLSKVMYTHPQFYSLSGLGNLKGTDL
jgi:hypothetical protein